MRRPTTNTTTTGKRLKARVKRITSVKSRGLTPSQVAYRKHKKKLDDYYARERKLARGKW